MDGAFGAGKNLRDFSFLHPRERPEDPNLIKGLSMDGRVGSDHNDAVFIPVLWI